MSKNKVKIMMDSGAYSVWNSGQTINIDDYCSFLVKYKKYFESYINLDSIPGTKFTIKTPELVEKSAILSFDNLQYLEEKDLQPMPVYHRGESMDFLIEMVEAGYDYIGLAPGTKTSFLEKVEWFDSVFSYLTTEDGLPIIKTHGFAVTNPAILWKYPWHSVDSTSWIMCAVFGGVYIPKLTRDQNGYEYLTPPNVLKISKESPIKEKGVAHYHNTSGLFREYYNTYFDENGIDKEKLAFNQLERAKVNSIYFKNLENKIRTEGVRFKRKKSTIGFFDSSISSGSSEAVKTDFTLYYSTNLDKKKNGFLLSIGANLLLSYMAFRNLKKDSERVFKYICEGSAEY